MLNILTCTEEPSIIKNFPQMSNSVEIEKSCFIISASKDFGLVMGTDVTNCKQIIIDNNDNKLVNTKGKKRKYHEKNYWKVLDTFFLLSRKR